MVDINITKISSKGQVVIPLDMRKDLKEGDKLVVIRNKDQIILKKTKNFSKNIKEDLEFARRTNEALKRIENGEYISVDSENLEEEMRKW
ncbi:AbrB family transcriptional regulator [Candidatus Pacearchaeota archaeon]|jgi:AbrB family looped-hinge helix DNA binding protein|nr:AbrB family transcriptional regulator [Candidatus Pacearchaeota archaeon]|tara:strand:+ start:3906 stop:4175 length:270 start_codon:yes stop_codon:yes gene_type:complete